MNLRNLWPFKTADDLEKADRETTTLHQVKWVEEVEEEYRLITERIVWSGGAEKEIEYCVDNTTYPEHPCDIDGYEIFHIEERPAYREEIEERTVTKTREKTKRTWIDGEIPPGVEKTGKTKEISHKG